MIAEEQNFRDGSEPVAFLKTMEMKTALRQVQEAVGTDKFLVLASMLDSMRADHLELRSQIRVDDETETLDLDALAERYGVSMKTLREQLERELGVGVVMKIGKIWVIRKRKFLEFLQSKEGWNVAAGSTF